MPDSEAAVFVAGKPLTDIWGSAGLRWRAAVSRVIRRPLIHPYLRFIRNDRHPFDLDNLVYLMLSTLGCEACVSVWATVSSGPTERVWVAEASP